MRRLHPASLIFALARQVRALLVPAIAVLMLAEGTQRGIMLLVVFIPTVAISVLRYLTLRYAYTPSDLIVREGLVFRNERHIPYARIQNIDLVQSIWHRMLRVAEVRVETASGSEPEAILKVLSLDAVEQMRQRVFAGRKSPASDEVAASAREAGPDADAAAPPVARQTLVHLSPGELLRLGLISNRGLALVAIGLGLANELNLLERSESVRWVMDTWQRLVGGPVFLTLLVLLVAGGAALIAFSVIWTLLRFYDFTLSRSGDDLQWRCGLLTRHSATIPRHHLQLVSMQQSPLHRLFDRATLRVNTAGGGGKNEEDESALSRRWFVPILSMSRAGSLLAEVLPELQLDQVVWHAVSPRARGRVLRRMLVLLLLMIAVAAAIWGWWGLLAGGLLPIAIWYAYAYARSLGYALTEHHILFRSGLWTRRISAVPREKIQVVSLHQSPLDRRFRHAALHVDTAGASLAGHRIQIPYLNDVRGATLLRELSRDRVRTGAESRRIPELNEPTVARSPANELDETQEN